MPDKQVILYTGDHCHLCDQAKDILYPLLREQHIALQEINIASDPQLKERYGFSIPVLALPNGEEKGWPFTAGQVKRLLGSYFS